jgi:hypothetical protein
MRTYHFEPPRREQNSGQQLANEQVTITRIEYVGTKRGHNKWRAVASYDGCPVYLTVYPEDVRAIKALSYETSWSETRKTANVNIEVVLRYEQANGLRILQVLPKDEILA